MNMSLIPKRNRKLGTFLIKSTLECAGFIGSWILLATAVGELGMPIWAWPPLGVWIAVGWVCGCTHLMYLIKEEPPKKWRIRNFVIGLGLLLSIQLFLPIFLAAPAYPRIWIYRNKVFVTPWHGFLWPLRIGLGRVINEKNQEIKRLLMARYGEGRYIRETGAVEHHKDETGTLYRFQGTDYAIVKVTNASPEPNGIYKDYYLTVPSHISSAKEAVAWTWDVPPHQYKPEVQT